MDRERSERPSPASLSRRESLRALGAVGFAGFAAFGATSATGEPTRSASPSVSTSSSTETSELKGAERPVWAVQRTERREVNPLAPIPVKGGVQSFLNVYYLGAEWTERGTEWRHRFVLSGIGYSWNSDMSVDDWFENSTTSRPIVIEETTFGAEPVSVEASTRLRFRWLDSEGRSVDAEALKEELENLDDEEVAAFFTDLKAGRLEAGDVTRHDTITSINDQTNEPDDSASIVATLANLVGIDRAAASDRNEDLEFNPYGGFEYPVSPEPSTVQAHYQRFEVSVEPDVSGTIRVASGFKSTYPADEWISNSLSIDIEALGPGFWNLPTESRVTYDEPPSRWAKRVVKAGAEKPPTDGETTATIVEPMDVPTDRWSDRPRPTAPQHGGSYPIDEPVTLEGTASRADGIIDSNWWLDADCYTPSWAGPIDAEEAISYSCEDTVDAMHVQKWKDGQTTEHLYRFDIVADEPDDATEPPRE